jgi:flavin reductase (DIM6/NTAB) family NADH-FMN oxidoreductase RutF
MATPEPVPSAPITPPAAADATSEIVSIPVSELNRLREIEKRYNELQSGGGGVTRMQESLHPDWKAPQPQPSPHHAPDVAHVCLSPEKLGNCYQLFISAVAPRPIAFVSTVNAQGVANLAPYSYFGAMGHSPPILAIGMCDNRDGTPKDSLANVLETKELVVNIISEWMIESANFTCGPFPADVDEFHVAGLTKGECECVKAPRVLESAVSMECVVKETVRFGGATTVLVEVVRFHVHPGVLDVTTGGSDNPRINLEQFKPICRLGGNTYGQVTRVFDMPRPGKDDWQDAGVGKRE